MIDGADTPNPNANTNTKAPAMDTDSQAMCEDDLCHLEDVCVLLLCLSRELETEAIELLRRGKATRCSFYHAMGNFVITDSPEEVHRRYPQCTQPLLSIEW